jgi:ATP-binding cassette subfamily B (MDR/TAP) protein 1
MTSKRNCSIGLSFVKTNLCSKLQVFFALTMTAVGISQSGSMAPDASKAKSSVTSLFAILDRKSKIDSSDASGTIIENVKGDIELHNVSFRYPTRPVVQIFRDLCLAIHSGKVIYSYALLYGKLCISF